MTGNEVKKLFIAHIRNNEFELKGEIQRCKDKLRHYEPGTQEYTDTLKAYDILLSQEKELKKIRLELKKIAYGAAFMILGWITYRMLIDKAADPFFREIGKSFIKLIHV